METTTVKTPITMQEVRDAMAANPAATNAHRIRVVLGNRGSMETIQKHLIAIRAEQSPPAAPAPGATPPAPADAVQMLWTAAYSVAANQFTGRLESVSAERDALAAQTAEQTAEIDELVTALDTATVAAETAAAAADAAATQHAADIAAAAAATAAAQADIAALQATLATTQSNAASAALEAAHAAQIAQRDHSAGIAALQAALDQQINKYIDLKDAFTHMQVSRKVDPETGELL